QHRIVSLPCIGVVALLCACADDGRPPGSNSDGVSSLSTFGDTFDESADESGDTNSTGDGDGDPSGDGDGDPCQAGSGDVEGFIWIANSGEGTVSKIDTVTGVELGRYVVRPDSGGSPSRTTVNNRGDVAVANRLGGVTMVRANI